MVISDSPSLSQIQNEFGGSNPIALSEYYGVSFNDGTFAPSSDTIKFSNFRNKTHNPPVGEAVFTTPGTYGWTAPTNVTSVSVVCVGGGGGGMGYFGAGGAGGGLAYKNSIPVTPGSTYSVEVGAGGPGVLFRATTTNAGSLPEYNGTSSSAFGTIATGGQHGGRFFSSTRPTGGFPDGTYDSGGDGGICEGDESSGNMVSGGGGAGGYGGTGGKGAGSLRSGGTLVLATAGAGGGGGGGGARIANSGNPTYGGTGGGGTGLNGLGTNGAAGVSTNFYTFTRQMPDSNKGGGGSGGGSGNLSPDSTEGRGGSGGFPGGGGGSGAGAFVTSVGGDGGNGAIRIIWGPGRSFPNNAA